MYLWIVIKFFMHLTLRRCKLLMFYSICTWEVVESEPATAIFCVGVLAATILLILLSPQPKLLPLKSEVFAAPGWNRVAEVFKRHVKDRQHISGGFAVYHKGQLVVEFVGGHTRAELPWDKTTLSCLYEGTRGIGAIVIAILVDRGLLAYSSPVAKYWPEFAANGKGSITVEQLLSHQASPIVLDEVYSLFDITKNPSKLSHLLATARPHWKPGSKYAFHSLTMGLCMDQLVRRVDPHHRSLDQFFAEEVSRKFGIDCFIGLPMEENYRCAPLCPGAMCAVFDAWLSPKFWRCTGWTVVKNILFKKRFNDTEIETIGDDIPAFREIPCASTHGFATAAGLAKLYGILANGGRHENQTLLSPSAVQKLNEQVSGIKCIYCRNSTCGRGTVILKSADGHNIFGHPGHGGQAGFADPNHKIGWAYLTTFSSIDGCNDWKYRELIERVYETVWELEQREYTH